MNILFLAEGNFEGYEMEWPLTELPRAGDNFFVWDGESEWDLRLTGRIWDLMNGQITIWFYLESKKLTDEERCSLMRAFLCLDEKLNGRKE